MAGATSDGVTVGMNRQDSLLRVYPTSYRGRRVCAICRAESYDSHSQTGVTAPMNWRRSPATIAGRSAAEAPEHAAVKYD